MPDPTSTPTARLILITLRLSPVPLTYRELADQTGAALDTVKDYVRVLVRAGRVNRATVSRRTVCSLMQPYEVR
jgi:hypothetical protein